MNKIEILELLIELIVKSRHITNTFTIDSLLSTIDDELAEERNIQYRIKYGIK